MRGLEKNSDKLAYIERAQVAIKGKQPIGDASTITSVCESPDTWDIDIPPDTHLGPTGFYKMTGIHIIFISSADSVGIENVEFRASVDGIDYNLLDAKTKIVFISTSQVGGSLPESKKVTRINLRATSDIGERMKIKLRISSINGGTMTITTTDDGHVA